MTDREKEITAIENIIDYQLGDLCGNARDAAVALFNLDYRKADEVRNETAKEILHELKKLLVEPCKSYELCEDDLRRIAEKFGAEVEE